MLKLIIKQILNTLQTVLGVLEWILRRIISHNITCMNVPTSNGRKIRIIANGPTLLEELDAAPKIDTDYLMLNNSAGTEIFFKIKPTRYVMVDPLFFTKILIEDDAFRDAFLSVDWNMLIFVPASCVSMVRKLFASNRFLKVQPIPSGIPANVKIRSVRNFFFKHYLASPPLQNVVVGAIYSSIMSGFSNIELFGVGHSWTTQLAVNDQNQVCLRDVHYYEKDAPMQPWLQCDGVPYRMDVILRDLAQMFCSYWDLRYFADAVGDIRIVNKTRGSFIDAFDREYD